MLWAADKNLKNDIIMIRPLGTRVVIEPKEAETMTAGGLYIPDNAQEKPQQGTIVGHRGHQEVPHRETV